MHTWVPQLSQENMDGKRPIIDILNRYAAEKEASNALESALDSCKIYEHRGHIEVQGVVHKTIKE